MNALAAIKSRLAAAFPLQAMMGTGAQIGAENALNLGAAAGRLFGGQNPAFLQNPTPESKQDMGAVLATIYGGNAFNPAAMETNALGAGIKAYHGSPYDFDKFDASKIGTGEGAQAYGHGLYFAESPDVAKGYRETLANAHLAPGVKQAVDSGTIDTEIATTEKALASFLREREAFQAANRPNSLIEDRIANAQNKLEQMKAAKANPLALNGKMYEVNINASPDQFLDWNKPINEQPAPIQKYFAGKEPPQGQTWQGGDLIGGRDPTDQARIANELSQAGIPGIRYLDQGSRAAGEGSHNYVVFPGNEHLVEIVKKYGIAGAATMLGVQQSDLEAAFGGEQPKQNALAY